MAYVTATTAGLPTPPPGLPAGLAEAAALSRASLQVQEAYPFHDGWNVACFVILLLFVLTVLGLAALAALYQLLDCGCCAKGKTQRQLRQEEGGFRRMMSSLGVSSQSHTEVV